MGILKDIARVVALLPLPDGFSVCELGDQWMSGGKPQLAADWYRTRGCGRYVSIDGNGKATLTHDLNRPVDGRLERFDLVTDFGTGEHIFDQAEVWRTLHALVTPGGYLVVDRPSQGYAAHCYYRVDECLFRDIARVNRYMVLHLERVSTPRGELLRGVFKTPASPAPFTVPQQGRYLSSLVIA